MKPCKMDNCLKNIPTEKARSEKTDNVGTSEQQKWQNWHYFFLLLAQAPH